MTDSEYRKNNYKFLKISVGAIIKNPETQKCVPDDLKTKMMCENAVKKLQLLIGYVPDWYKTQEMCDEVLMLILL